MPYAHNNGVRYHFVEQGAGEPLVLLHGFTGSVINWQTQIDFLGRYFRVIAFDLLGHGRTDAPDDPTRYRIENAAIDLVSLFTELIGKPVNLLGYSMGGRLAMHLAAHHADRISRLLLESASPGLATEQERIDRTLRDDELADQIERNGVASFVSVWEHQPIFATQKRLDAQVRSRLRQQRLQNEARGLANSLRGMGTGVQPSLWEQLAAVRTPTLLLAGELDRKFVGIAEQMHARLLNSTLAQIPDAGHTIHLEQPDVFNQIVLDYLVR